MARFLVVVSVALMVALMFSSAHAKSKDDGAFPERAKNPCESSCDVEAIELSDFPQWEHENGYWIGEYSIYDSDGSPRQSGNDWNYPYDHYRGFITGNVEGGAYRQRNVFLYPPQASALCGSDESSVIGEGECGTNGNSKVFEADQAATTCDVHMPGAIEGPYGSLTYTYTSLIGQDNSLLYQVYLTKDSLNFYERVVMGNPYNRCDETTGECGYDSDRLMQSQLTTLTQALDGSWMRTRTAQGFDAFGDVGKPTYSSFYRERKVSQEEFWSTFNATVNEYGILSSDLCAWASGETGGTVPSGMEPGFDSCREHLLDSFSL